MGTVVEAVFLEAFSNQCADTKDDAFALESLETLSDHGLEVDGALVVLEALHTRGPQY